MSFLFDSYSEQVANGKRDHYGFKRDHNFVTSQSDGDKEKDKRDASPSSDESNHDTKPSRSSPISRASTTQQPAQKQASAPPKWIPRAHVSNLACGNDGSEAARVKHKLKDVDLHVLERIKKAITLAGHAGTGEAEARNAMRIAQKLMQVHNVSQADIMAQESDEQRAKRAGSSVVEIRTRSSDTDEEGLVVFSGWYDTLADTMGIFFNVKSYWTKWSDRSRITFTFYGIAEGTVAAAQAFEWIHNLIIKWRDQKQYATRNMYCHGVVDELEKLAKRERKQEERAAARAEKERLAKASEEDAAQRAAEIARLGPISTSTEQKMAKVEDAYEMEETKLVLSAANIASADEEVNADFRDRYSHLDTGQSGFRSAGFNETDEIDEKMDLDAVLRDAEERIRIKSDPDMKRPKFEHDIDIKTNPNEQSLNAAVHVKSDPDVKPAHLQPKEEDVKVKPEPDEDAPSWENPHQLQLFRNHAVIIADTFLKEKKVDLSAGRARYMVSPSSEHAKAAYKRGRQDARSIEVKRRRIGAAE